MTEVIGLTDKSITELRQVLIEMGEDTTAELPVRVLLGMTNASLAYEKLLDQAVGLFRHLAACTSTEVVGLDGWRDVRVPEELWRVITGVEEKDGGVTCRGGGSR